MLQILLIQLEEVEGAIEEGCEVLELCKPLRIEKDEEGNVTGVYIKPQSN